MPSSARKKKKANTRGRLCCRINKSPNHGTRGTCGTLINNAATPGTHALSLHDALPIYPRAHGERLAIRARRRARPRAAARPGDRAGRRLRSRRRGARTPRDRKSTRLNSSHPSTSYAVFCQKKKKSQHSGQTLLSHQQISQPWHSWHLWHSNQQCGHPRHSRSFPTRRSSDLSSRARREASYSSAAAGSASSCGSTWRSRRKATAIAAARSANTTRSEEHTSELQSPVHLVCRLLPEKKKKPTLGADSAVASTNLPTMALVALVAL